jgi:hypothetical protein
MVSTGAIVVNCGVSVDVFVVVNKRVCVSLDTGDASGVFFEYAAVAIDLFARVFDAAIKWVKVKVSVTTFVTVATADSWMTMFGLKLKAGTVARSGIKMGGACCAPRLQVAGAIIGANGIMAVVEVWLSATAVHNVMIAPKAMMATQSTI